MLYGAMALAVAAGLSALPPLDPLEVLREQAGPWGLLTALLHLCVAGLCTLACRRAFVRQGFALQGRRMRWLCAAAVLGAWLWWLGSWQFTEVADGRALLWLEMLPLWLWPAGLLSPGPVRESGLRRSVPAAPASARAPCSRWHTASKTPRAGAGPHGRPPLPPELHRRATRRPGSGTRCCRRG
jgi:hypothetical protein